MASHRQATPPTKRFARAWPRNPSFNKPKRSPGTLRVRSPPTLHIREASSHWTPPRHAKTPQDAPKTHQNCLKILQDTLKTAKESHKLAGAPQHSPKRPQNGLWISQDVLKRHRHSPRTAPRHPKMGPRPQDTPEKLRDCPKAARHAQPPPGTNQELENLRFYTDFEGSFRRSFVLQCFLPLAIEPRLTSLVEYDGRFGVAAPLDLLICSDARIRRQW